MIADLRRHPKRTEMPLTVFPFALHGDPNVLTVVEGPQWEETCKQGFLAPFPESAAPADVPVEAAAAPPVVAPVVVDAAPAQPAPEPPVPKNRSTNPAGCPSHKFHEDKLSPEERIAATRLGTLLVRTGIELGMQANTDLMEYVLNRLGGNEVELPPAWQVALHAQTDDVRGRFLRGIERLLQGRHPIVESEMPELPPLVSRPAPEVVTTESPVQPAPVPDKPAENTRKRVKMKKFGRS
jgi:hypothetical protein